MSSADSTRPLLPIPIAAARRIANDFGYDQVIVIARRVGGDSDTHGEHVTTYGVNKAHCDVVANVGNFLKHKVMGWPEYNPQEVPEAVLSRVQNVQPFAGDNDATRIWQLFRDGTDVPAAIKAIAAALYEESNR